MVPTQLEQLERTGHYHWTLCKGPNTSRWTHTHFLKFVLKNLKTMDNVMFTLYTIQTFLPYCQKKKTFSVTSQRDGVSLHLFLRKTVKGIVPMRLGNFKPSGNNKVQIDKCWVMHQYQRIRNGSTLCCSDKMCMVGKIRTGKLHPSVIPLFVLISSMPSSVFFYI